MAFLWLALCLTPACCLLHKDEDPESPIKNLRMQPETRRLTWDLSGNVSEIGCFINSRFITKATDKRYCEFRVLSSCQVTNFTVASTGDRPFSAGILYPRPEGHPEAAAQRLGCWVHDVDFLTCSWEAGRAAPGDVQYRLYWQDLKTYEEEECPRYGVDDRGTHIRCHFDDVSRLGEHVRFLVKGTSKGARIPCSDLTVELARIERLSLPNITGMCNKSYSVMEWKMSSHFNHRFTYELEIQKGSDAAYTEKAPDSYFVLPNPGNYAVRLRAHARFRKTWSEWSAVRRFECDLGKDAHFRDWLASALIPLGALLALGLGVALCQRYSVLQKLFPPIPHLKDPITDTLHSSKLVAWEASRASQEDCQVAEVQVLREM
ncbi:interleukin-3 receptor subunit alpha isoform X1 [Panthera tigris]|uniref:interleukin-3 receptor subunit alpha isoform X1 n=2 Tax=Panthera tigris TaxID=9694 RepID=UPI001C6FBDA3|nr:interleukin-3 receptor subunit alpha isoform X1 [Panthera tigris]